MKETMDLFPKPCPFCGHQPEVSLLRARWVVGCTARDCQAHPSVVGGTELEVVDSWNTRPQLAQAETEPAL